MDKPQLNVGDYVVIGFGNGTQLIYVSAITRTGSYKIQRCQAWLGKDAHCDPHWTGTLSTLKKDDQRIDKIIERPSRIPLPFTLERIKACQAAGKAYERARVEKRVSNQPERDRLGEVKNQIREDAKTCCPPEVDKHGNEYFSICREHVEGCSVETRHRECNRAERELGAAEYAAGSEASAAYHEAHPTQELVKA